MRIQGIEYRHFSTIDSTNALASRMLASEEIESWTVLTTDTQTHGRGQRGTTWQDESAKNLLMTVVTPTISWPSKRVAELNMCLSTAIVDVFGEVVLAKLKWPNDVLVGRSKLAGILVEPVIRGNFVQRLVIGLGVNVNQVSFEDGLNATSLCLLIGEEQDVHLWKQKIAEAIARALIRLTSTGMSPKPEYLKRCVSFGEVARYRDSEGEFEAVFTDVDEHGRQILSKSDGSVGVYDIKGVSLLLDSI